MYLKNSSARFQMLTGRIKKYTYNNYENIVNNVIIIMIEITIYNINYIYILSRSSNVNDADVTSKINIVIILVVYTICK